MWSYTETITYAHFGTVEGAARYDCERFRWRVLRLLIRWSQVRFLHGPPPNGLIE